MYTDAPRRGVVALMSVSTGVIIANVYCAQPLTDTLARAMRVPAGSIGVVLTLIQLGFALGLMTLVPLGDLVERRRLLAILLAVCVLGMTGMALAPSLAVLELGAVFVGLTGVCAQILVPFAAHLAPAQRRGQVVSTVMSGLLIGILLSRTVAGVLAQFAGWRAVFGLSACGTAVVGVLLYRALPRVAPSSTLSYPRLLGSVLTLVRTEPVLRLRMIFGALAFATFSAFWASAGFILAKPPYSWNNAAIGAFALIGIAGALAARLAGRLADAGHAWRTTGVCFAITAVSYLAMLFDGGTVFGLAVGVAAMDLGSQGTHVSNQSVIYQLAPAAHSRITTAYMTAYFLAGAAGSGLSSVLVYPNFGATGVYLLGAAFPVLGLLLWVLTPARRVERVL